MMTNKRTMMILMVMVTMMQMIMMTMTTTMMMMAMKRARSEIHNGLAKNSSKAASSPKSSYPGAKHNKNASPNSPSEKMGIGASISTHTYVK